VMLFMEELPSSSRRYSERAPDLGYVCPTLPNVDSAQAMKQAEDIKKPENHGDDDNAIEDRLDTALHGDEAIHEPKQDAHDDKRDN
jgi:hypothetical protein